MTDQQFGDWLRIEIRRREWNLSDFARRANVDSSMVSRWARNERLPSPESCDVIADVLGVDVDLVLSLAGHRPAEVGDDPPDLRRLTSLLRRAYRDDALRISTIESVLRNYIEWDRQDAAKAQSE